VSLTACSFIAADPVHIHHFFTFRFRTKSGGPNGHRLIDSHDKATQQV
jgi:hypothetical protein